MHEITGLFPTPFMRATNVLPSALVAGLIDHFGKSVNLANSSSPNLSHTALLKPGDSPLLVDVAVLLNPLLPEFSALLFGERLGWSLKEMWVNVLDTGGRQAMHNHANSFISGVVYLTRTHPDARTAPALPSPDRFPSAADSISPPPSYLQGRHRQSADPHAALRRR